MCNAKVFAKHEVSADILCKELSNLDENLDVCSHFLYICWGWLFVGVMGRVQTHITSEKVYLKPSGIAF